MTSVPARLARGARRIASSLRGRVPGLVVLAVAAIVAVVAAVSWHNADQRARSATVPSFPVGVRDGDSVPAYIAAQRAELSTLETSAPTQPVYALVSFDNYLSPPQIADLPRSDLSTIAGYARVPVARRQTELVRLAAARIPDDLTAAMKDVARRKAQEAAKGGPGADLARQEADAYAAGCSCVYALVVQATPVALGRFSQAAHVRAVDAAPELTDVAYGAFVALLPEQVDVVAPLPDDGLPPNNDG